MIKFSACREEYVGDLMELIRLFESRTDEEIALDVNYRTEDGIFNIELSADKFGTFKKFYSFPITYNCELERKRVEKRYLKVAIYRTLCFLTGVELPYGCLTGIRPTKLFCEIDASKEKYGGRSASEVFSSDYGVSPAKVALIERTVDVQKPYRNVAENYDVFVFIPFCPTRCAYCSFVSLPLNKQQKLVAPYVECLKRELLQLREIVTARELPVRAVYVGGGTPTSIGVENLSEILDLLDFGAKEFTVEAGRPDTISKDMVDMLIEKGVTRVSVNPQTFCDRTLEILGRQHRVSDIYGAYALVKGKLDVNMDLIAMLPGESFEDFCRSVDIAVMLGPENITVHTLYLKHGSRLKLENYDGGDFDTAAKMVDYAYKKLTESGYSPYYMYRQKYTSGNLENVGYCKQGKACLYNIDIMEEDTSILAAGANAISKKWDSSKNLITRCANYKEPLEYVKNIDMMLERQRDFFASFR